MELTIKDLAKYLPYGLGTLEIFNMKTPKTIKGINLIDKAIILGEKHIRSLGAIKPIMRPLSQLVEEITHNRETFVPIVELAKVHNYAYGWKAIEKELPNRWFAAIAVQENKEKDYLTDRNLSLVFSYSKKLNVFKSDIGLVAHQELLFQKLYEWHFWTGDQSYFENGILIEKK